MNLYCIANCGKKGRVYKNLSSGHTYFAGHERPEYLSEWIYCDRVNESADLSTPGFWSDLTTGTKKRTPFLEVGEIISEYIKAVDGE